MPLMGFPCGAFLFLAQLVGQKFAECNRWNCHRSEFADMRLKIYRVCNEGKASVYADKRSNFEAARGV